LNVELEPRLDLADFTVAGVADGDLLPRIKNDVARNVLEPGDLLAFDGDNSVTR
jgi:hypothetical protein